MSGGSYDYLFAADDLGSRYETIERMQDRLAELGYKDVSEATGRVLKLLDAADEQAAALREVWHDVEWLDSGDYGLDQVYEEICRFRQAGNQQ